MRHRVLRSHRNKKRIKIYVDHVHHVHHVHRTSCAQVHDLPQNHCGDNRKGTLFA